MRKPFLRLYCLVSLLAFPVGAIFAETDPEDGQSCESVISTLAEGGSGADVIRSTREAGMDLAEASVYAMVCGGEENRVAIATAGIAAAENLAQAQSVAYALLATAGKTGPVADAVRGALDEFSRLMGQPDVYQDDFTPLGGGVSPAA